MTTPDPSAETARDPLAAALRDTVEAVIRRDFGVCYPDGAKFYTTADRVLAAIRDTPATTPHPGENHEFRTVCQRCGENGYLHVGVITDLEVVKIEPRESASTG